MGWNSSEKDVQYYNAVRKAVKLIYGQVIASLSEIVQFWTGDDAAPPQDGNRCGPDSLFCYGGWTMKSQQPQWQPISLLPVFTDMIDGMLEASLAQLSNLKLAAEKPHVLDDDTLNRAITLYSEQLDDHWLFEEQFARWKRGRLSDTEAREVDRLVRQAARLKATNEEILQIAHSIEHATIDKITAMDDVELGLKVLTGQIKPPS